MMSALNILGWVFVMPMSALFCCGVVYQLNALATERTDHSDVTALFIMWALGFSLAAAFSWMEGWL